MRRSWSWRVLPCARQKVVLYQSAVTCRFLQWKYVQLLVKPSDMVCILGSVWERIWSLLVIVDAKFLFRNLVFHVPGRAAEEKARFFLVTDD